MDTKRACQILNVKKPFQESELKKAWRTAALKHHPDKSRDPESEERFIEAQEAFAFLSMCEDNDRNEPLLRDLFRALSESVLCENGQQFILDIFKRLDHDKAMKVLHYADMFNVNCEVISKMRDIVEANSDTVVIRPEIQNLLNSDIYCFDYNGTIYYIPMWHHEMVYGRLLVRCLPNLPSHICIDDKGSFHVTVKTTATKVFKTRGINITIGKEDFFIPGEKLQFTSFQTYVFEGRGAPQINHSDVFDNTKRGNICVHLELI